jgi:prepilin-type N-terminal cleavage/methylation domain-containing protein
MAAWSTGKHRSQAGVTLVELLVVMIIMGIVSTMLVAGWISLQRASAFAVQTNDARATARDALSRVSTELRDMQPTALPIGTPLPTPTPTYTEKLLTNAQPMTVTFYSVYNQPGAGNDVSGIGARRLTRIRLDTSGSSPQKTLYWERDVSNNGVFGDPTDRTILLARNVVNASMPNTDVTPTTTYTAIFTYGYRDGSGFHTADTIASADLAGVISVSVRLIIDGNLAHAPAPIDVTTTVLPRNAATD